VDASIIDNAHDVRDALGITSNNVLNVELNLQNSEPKSFDAIDELVVGINGSIRTRGGLDGSSIFSD
jgi:hypothetical protein